MRAAGRLVAIVTFIWSSALVAQVPVQVPLHDHVLPALALATPAGSGDAAVSTDPGSEVLTLTVVLRRTDTTGFARFLDDLYDPQSSDFRKFLTPAQVSDRFGPSNDDYAAVLQYFTQRGFTLSAGSANRMTLTVRGTRSAAEQALQIRVGDYQLGGRSFFANTGDPMLPADIASRVEAVMGLSNLAKPSAKPQPVLDNLPDTPWNRALWYALCANYAVNGGFSAATGFQVAFFQILLGEEIVILSLLNSLVSIAQASDLSSSGTGQTYAKCVNQYNKKYGYSTIGGGDPPPPAWQGADGTGQTIGLVEFDTFVMSDVTDYVALMGQPAGPIGNVSQVHLNGGATLGPNQDEVLLDIDDILTAAPGAHIAVYDAPFTGSGTSFQTMFNAMISDGVTIISNSWSYCEDQTTLADVQSIDTILQAAAASGISVFSGAGDRGSTCLDGSPNTAHVPASSPHITAVGGTSLQQYPGFTYGKETWWNDAASTPPGGQGGFGVSRFFARPAYQNSVTGSAMRSIPDVSANADPHYGVKICQASNGGCPTGGLYGGTSSSTPMWAAFAALLNQTQGSNLGFFNPLIYPLAGTSAFHSPASMQTDFAHVGLGSPNLARLHQHLTGQPTGPASPSVSSVRAYAQTTAGLSQAATAPLPSYADGTTQTFIVVTLVDDNGIPVGGKTITPSAGAGNSAAFTPAIAKTDADTGVAIFWVTDTAIETITITATDTTDGVVLNEKPKVQFFSTPAASGGINATPTSVPPDQTTPTTITVTLQDATGAGARNKLVSLSQGAGHSVISGPVPALTDVNGQVQFTATNGVAETVVYTAVDVTDANLAVPGNATITFSGTATSCVGAAPGPGSGFALTPFATGFFAQAFFYGNVNWGGCPGASNPTFDPSGAVYAADFRTGDLFQLGLNGGAVSNANRLSNLTPTLGQPTLGKDARLYATHGSTGGGFTTGDLVEIDRVTGAQIRVVAANLTCPGGLAVDPLSGDLFFDGQCFGAGSNDPNIYRVHDPAGSATKTVYATLPESPNGNLAFSPDGTLYALMGYEDTHPAIMRIDGTDKPQPPAMAPFATTDIWSYYWVTIGEVNSNGSAKSLIVLDDQGLELVDITTVPFTHTLLITGNSVGSGVIGPDGCLYTSGSDTIYKLTNAAGQCGFVPTNPSPALSLSPGKVAPDPAQGGTQTFSATFNNVTTPIGTPVMFSIDGANSQLKLGTTDANGTATISYVGVLAGTDTVTATGTAAGKRLKSNAGTVTWVAGHHKSALGLGVSPSASTACGPATLSASLTDTSANPLSAIAGAPVHFTLGAQSCDAVTDVKGIASCTVKPAGAGQFTMTATFAGNSQFTSATATQQFTVPASTGGGATPLCAYSRKVHGTAGTFDLPLSPTPTLPTIEPRIGPTHTIVFSFDGAVSAAGSAIVTEGVAVAGAPTISGNDVVVPLTGITDKQYVTVTLSGVVSTNTASGVGSVRIGFLVGDVNQSRLVAVTDLVVVNNQLGRPLTTSNFLSDVNVSGIITVLDKVVVNNALGHFLPAP